MVIPPARRVCLAIEQQRSWRSAKDRQSGLCPRHVKRTMRHRCAVTKDGICSRVSFPLFYGGAVIGVCCMGSRQAAHFQRAGYAFGKKLPLCFSGGGKCPSRAKIEGDLPVSSPETAERKRIEESLCKLSLTVEQSPSAIIITDTKGDIEYVKSKVYSVNRLYCR